MTEYRIEELARRAGTTVRNVRSYQDRGLLEPPRREGRVAWYSNDHLDRLQSITQLLGRGFTLASIRELLEARADGLGLDHLVDLGRALTDTYASDEPRTFSLTELADLYGPDGEALEAINRAVKLGILRPENDGFVADDPAVVEGGGRLVRAGVPVTAMMDAFERIRAALDALAADVVDLVASHVVEPAVFREGRGPQDLDEQTADSLARAVRDIRPVAHTVVVAELGHAIQRAIEARLTTTLGTFDSS